MSSNQAATNITSSCLTTLDSQESEKHSIEKLDKYDGHLFSLLSSVCGIPLTGNKTNQSFREAYICNSKSQFQFQNNKPIPGPEQEQQLWGCYETLVSKS
ncbi:hypothetical protein C5167_001826 [Papaver somniferum]|uniref:Uncharacterized protein n=1 Tax=Papaver somniferum TaxID=3469 RepID=A0A4Y7KWD5_PAPSO|nr:hypothetical protein C5167_001826 [Papaver somniferum]